MLHGEHGDAGPLCIYPADYTEDDSRHDSPEIRVQQVNTVVATRKAEEIVEVHPTPMRSISGRQTAVPTAAMVNLIM